MKRPRRTQIHIPKQDKSMRVLLKFPALPFMLLLLLFLLAQPQMPPASADPLPERPEVIFSDGPGARLTELFRQHANELFAAINEHHQSGEAIHQLTSEALFQGVDGEFGLGQLESLLRQTRFHFIEEVQNGMIVTLVDGNHEIRQTFVQIGIEVEHERDRTQELVLTLNDEGAIIGARFAIQQHRFDEILNASRSLEDQFRRLQMVSYLERFRTAYNRKDIDFIEQQFSEQALIITGTRIETAEVDPLEPRESHISQDEYRFLRQTRDEYIARLRDVVFKRNEFINVNFEDIKIYQHPDYDEVYGVNLFQIWDSSTYSDVGYLFLMIDYEDETRPTIYVRAWQPEPFANGRVIDMEMFELVK